MKQSFTVLPALVFLAGIATTALGQGDRTQAATGPSKFVSVSAGSAHFCGLDSDGDVYCWGDGQWGQLGNGSTESSPVTPVRVASFQHFRQVVAGSTHTCALTDNGYPYCWGTDLSGVMGDATVRQTCQGSPCATRPTPVAIGFRFDSLAAGYEHSCGLRAGVAYCWGRDDAGQLGVSGRMEACDAVACSRVPRVVSDSLRFSSIVARGAHTCGLASAQLWCWGDNGHMELTGAADVGTTARPIAVSTADAFVQVSMAGGYTCAVTRAGSVECWGTNDRGRLGAPSGDATRGRVAPPHGRRFVRVSAGGSHTCALTSQGEAYCWGSDIDGRLGGLSFGNCGDLPCSAEPVPVPVHAVLTDVAAGGSMTCATAVDGAIYCWGGDARHAIVVAQTPQ